MALIGSLNCDRQFTVFMNHTGSSHFSLLCNGPGFLVLPKMCIAPMCGNGSLIGEQDMGAASTPPKKVSMFLLDMCIGNIGNSYRYVIGNSFMYMFS